jgi:hypothetical protein
MRFLGLLLVASGWLIAITAIVLLAAGPAQLAFLLSAVGIQLVGFVLIARSHPIPTGRMR